MALASEQLDKEAVRDMFLKNVSLGQERMFENGGR